MESMMIQNPLGIIIGAVLAFVLSFIWYNPRVFGSAWMQANGITEGDESQSGPPILAMVVLFAYLLALGVFLSLIQAAIPAQFSTMTILLMLVGVLGTGGSLFGNRSKTVWAINGGYDASCIAVVALSLAYFA